MKEFLMSFYKEKIPPIKPTFWQKCLIILDKETEAFSSFFMYVVAFTTVSSLIMDMCSSSPFKLFAFYWAHCFVVNFIFGFAIAIIVDGEANKITNSSKGKIISLIKNHMTEPVLNEILLKVSLIDLYSLDEKSILDLKIFNQSINQIENKIITHKAIDTVSNWMLNPVLIDEYNAKYSDLVKLSIKDLELNIKAQLANTIAHHEKQLSAKESFVKKYATVFTQNDEIFKNENKQTLSL